MLLSLIALSAILVSCSRKENSSSSASNARPKTNSVSRFNDKGRLVETLTYSPDGSLKHRILFQPADDGRILSSRMVDPEGKLKWVEEHVFEGTNAHPLETRRITPDGATVLIRYRYDQNGNSTRTVVKSDGSEVPPDEVKRFLGE